MSARPPLTHHDILARVEPLVRLGRAVDLAATERLERRIAFRSTDHPPVPAADGSAVLPALREMLILEDGDDDGAPDELLRLTRTLTTPDGLQARLVAEGTEAGSLLQRIEAVAPGRQVFRSGDAIVVLSQRLGADDPVLRSAEARVAGLALEMEVSRVSGYPAELTLQWQGSGSPDWPEDLLAVLGRPWDRLRTAAGGRWVANLQLRGREPRRSADAQERLLRTVAHLGTTLSEPPARFHERHRRARWGVSLRNTVPLLIGLAVVAAALLVQRQGSEGASILGLMANAAPPLLMLAFFMRREMPRLELPRVPLRPRPDAWVPTTAPHTPLRDTETRTAAET